MKQKSLVNQNPYGKEFLDTFEILANKYGKFKVWNDLITMIACALSNSADSRFYIEREQRYLDTVKRYTKDEVEHICEMFATITLALYENPEQDFLGEMFMELKLNNSKNGEVFTPYSLAVLTAQINLTCSKEEFDDKEEISSADYCCGSGALLIAYANESKKVFSDFKSRAVLVAQDINPTIALMCYIQLSLLGYKAIVKIGDSLQDPFSNADKKSENVWLTPAYVKKEICEIISLTTAILSEKFGQEKKNSSDRKKEKFPA